MLGYAIEQNKIDIIKLLLSGDDSCINVTNIFLIFFFIKGIVILIMKKNLN